MWTKKKSNQIYDPQLVIVVLHKNILHSILQYYLALATLFCLDTFIDTITL